jgi:hypothetical protein
MAREKKDNVIITFRAPKQMASELDEEIALWNEETGASFTRTQMLQVLIMRFLIGRVEERKTDNAIKELKNKEEN